ncbi:MAG: cytochrome b/b6 domain-containing protein [Candidatus Hydrogenedentes bacterium]|nr:cytochrome b/b6 domain-containing protein [Candidatus Hydrogenedentota bacterium]
MRMMRNRALLPALIVLAVSASAPSLALEDQECVVCHGDPTQSKQLPSGKVLSLYVDAAAYAKSVHGANGCVSCHAGITELPHPEQVDRVNCSVCHAQAEEYAQSLHGKALAHGDKDVAACQDCHGKHDILPKNNVLSRVHPRNQPQTCGTCHSNHAMTQKHMVSITDPSDSYLKSNHARAIAKGNEMAAACSTCHGSHTILPAMDPASPVYRPNIPAMCGVCHKVALEEFNLSIHGKALAKGIKDAPTCIDCHGEHDIEGHAEKNSSVSLAQVSKATCPRCHDNEKIMKRYGIEVVRQASYMDSYHGMATEAGSKVVANCTSCHGVHGILPAADPQSSIAPENLPKTCGKCHEDAGPNFASSPVHMVPTDPAQWVLGLVRILYIWLIVLVLGSMAIHNLLLMGRRSLVKLFHEWRGPDTYRRFNSSQTIGHFVLAVTFITLAISGFALRYPNSWFAHVFFMGGDTSDARGLVHRVAGVVLIGITVLNAVYSVFWKRGRQELRAVMIRWKDCTDVVGNLKYALGLAKEPPRFDRYSYSEKFEYWGLWWGSVLMAVTGICMWYPDDFMKYFPRVVLGAAALIHYYEAWLAVGTIVIWHWYFMIFDPESYPMNWTWITGKITEIEFKERHPIEYEKVTQLTKSAPSPDDAEHSGNAQNP